MKNQRRNRSTSQAKRSQLVRRADAQKKIAAEYSVLEPRQLLATDFGLNFTGSTYQTNSNVDNPNMQGDIGTTHAIEAIVDRIQIFDRFTGAKILDKTQTQFFIDIGGTVQQPITNSQVIFDKLDHRWIIVGEGAGGGNYLHLAISNTANPANGWLSLRFVGDSVGVRHNGELSVGMDADALLITTRNTASLPGFPLSSSVYTIPKVDLYQPSPTVTNMSRFENLDAATYGDYLRAASSFEASDGRATFIGNLGNGTETTRFDVVGPAAAGATITPPTKILFNFNPFVPTLNFGAFVGPGIDARQEHPDDLYIANNRAPGQGATTNIYADAVDMNGSLWFVQSTFFDWGGAGESTVALMYEITKDGYVSSGPTFDFGGPPLGPLAEIPANGRLQVQLVAMQAGDPRGPDPWEWDVFNPSIDVNEFGIVNVNYTISTQEYFEDPDPNYAGFATAASSTGVTVNGKSQYDPIFDTIFWTERNTQFAAPVFIQPGLDVYQNNGLSPSTWSYRSSTNFDPLDVNNFWSNVQWANTTSRWSTQFTELSPNRLIAEITANDLDNVITIRRNAVNNSLMEVEIDGTVTDLLPYSVVGRLIINGFDGSDTYFIDFSNGDPIPDDGLEIDGMRGPDVIQTNDPNGARFVVDQFAGGTFNEKTDFRNIEELEGGDGNDSFLVTNRINPATNQVISAGFIDGSLVGNGGDDLFHFAFIDVPNVAAPNQLARPKIGDSVIGGTGFNTLSFENSQFDTQLELLGYGLNAGYEGRSVAASLADSPIGGDQPDDRFYDISFVMGSLTHFDGIRQANGIFDEQINVLVDDEDSIYESNGVQLGFFEVNAVSGSSFVDTFIGIRNRVNPLQLNGLGADDVYHFSSDAPTNMGSTSPLQGLLFAQGGAGNNVMSVSNRGGTANTNGLILNNRISGIGEIAYNAIGGTFALTVWTSEFGDKIDLHSFFLTNTLNLHLLGGDDRISIQDLSKATINVYGGDGDDVYAIDRIQNIDLRNLSLIDSVGSERDRVTLVGTLLDETFDIDSDTFVDLNVIYVGIEVYGVEGRAGKDTFNIRSTNFELYIDGESGDDVFNIASDAPFNLGDVTTILNDVTIEGGSGRNVINVSARSSIALKNVTVFADYIEGMLPTTLFYRATGGSFSKTTGDGGIYLVGSDNFPDTFTVTGLLAGNTMKIDSLGGDDYFNVQAGALGNVLLNGGAGNDRYQAIFSGTGGRRVTVNDNGVSGDDRLIVVGTSAADVVSISSTVVSRGGETVVRQSPLTLARVLTMGGDDTISLNGGIATNVHLFGGDGIDNLQVNGTSAITGLRLYGESGDDILQFNATLAATSSQAYGGDGDDRISFSQNVLGNSSADGEGGSDRVTITVAGGGTRFLDIRDSGTTGTDMHTIYGTAGNDTFWMSSVQVSYLSQRVVFDSSSERLTLTMLDGLDSLVVTGSAAAITRVNAGNGDDSVEVRSTDLSPQLTVDGQAGNDIISVVKTSAMTNTTVLGGTGNDQFFAGSNLQKDNGKLDDVQGFVSYGGGTNGTNGEDRLIINDHGTSGAYNYFLTPKVLRSLPGPNQLARPLFKGINFDGEMEFVRLDGTAQANYFVVDASQDTTFYIDGNAPNPSVVNGDSLFLRSTQGDGHVQHIISPSLGTGYWSFTNGNEFVRYENIEFPYATPESSFSAPPAMYGAGLGLGGNSGNNYPSGGGSPMAMFGAPTGGSGNSGSGVTPGQLYGSIPLDDDGDLLGDPESLFHENGTSVDSLDEAFSTSLEELFA